MTKRSPRILLTTALLLVGVMGDTAAFGQEDAAEAGAFFEQVDVNVVNIEVYVTDKKGEVVTGLMVDDFELEEDGKPVKVSNFYAVVDGRPVTPVEAPTPITDEPALPGRTIDALPEIAPNQRLHIILYIDNLHIRPFNRQQALRDVRRFLSTHVKRGDRMMVVTADRAIKVQQPFTADLGLIHHTLDEIEMMTGYAVQGASNRNEVIKSIDRSNSFEEALSFVDFYSKEIYTDTLRSIDSLRELVEPLAGLVGRKAILHISDGVPMTAGADLYHLVDLRFGKRGSAALHSRRYDARTRFRELINTSNANRVTFYTLEAAGLRSHSSLSAEHRSSADGGSMIDVDLTNDMNLQETLQMMALDTGGLSAINTNNLSGMLERVASDLSSYYSLGYNPPSSGDGRSHKIEVRVKRPGLKVRHRTSYRDKTPEARLIEGVMASLRYGRETNPMSVRLVVTGAQPDGGRFLVPITVSVPFKEVTFIPREDLHHGQLKLVMAVIDEEGGTSPPEITPMPLEIPGHAMEQVLRQDVVYTAELRIKAGVHVIAVGLRDELSGAVSLVRQAVRIGGG